MKYQSEGEQWKYTLQAMKENARQGYWNGARPPIGYHGVAAEQRRQKTKRSLRSINSMPRPCA